MNALPFTRAVDNVCVLCGYNFSAEMGQRLVEWDVLSIKLIEMRRLISLYKLQLNLNDPMRSMTLERIHSAVSVIQQLDR